MQSTDAADDFGQGPPQLESPSDVRCATVSNFSLLKRKFVQAADDNGPPTTPEMEVDSRADVSSTVGNDMDDCNANDADANDADADDDGIAQCVDAAVVREPPPPPLEQAEIIRDFDVGDNKVELKEGDTWYLVDCKWFAAWQEYVGYESGEVDEAAHPGAIDNTGLLENAANANTLRPYVHEMDHYMLVPAVSWQRLAAWYGGGPAIGRDVVRKGYSRTLCVDVSQLSVMVVRSSAPTAPATLRISKYAPLSVLRDRACALLHVAPDDVQLWDYHQNVKAKLLGDLTLSLYDENIINGQAVLLEERGPDGKWPKMVNARDFRESSTAVAGRCGLQNLGNTCFMNSALQCLSATAPLRRFFQSGAYERDLNPDNALGCGGELAGVFGDMLDALWAGRYTSFAPRDFKHRLERFAQQFAGYQQHDSQELLSFLLDGLHEDLNRVLKKPYVELKEADGRPDSVVADEAWHGHVLRNDSIIVDWFQGQLKSTVECNECDRVSITFDPFMYLSLPLPVVTTRLIDVRGTARARARLQRHSLTPAPQITVVRADGSPPLVYRVMVEKSALVGTLKAELSKLCLVAPEALVVADVYMSRIHTDFVDAAPVQKISDHDKIFAYEVLPPPPPSEPTTPRSGVAGADDDLGASAQSAVNDESADIDAPTTDDKDEEQCITKNDNNDDDNDARDDDDDDDERVVDEEATDDMATDDADNDDGDEGGPFYLIILQKHSTTGFGYFGLPQILSFESKPTYAQLARDVYRRFKRCLKPAAHAAAGVTRANTEADEQEEASANAEEHQEDAETEQSETEPAEPANADAETTWDAELTPDERAAARDMKFSVAAGPYNERVLQPSRAPIDLSSRDIVTVTYLHELDFRYDPLSDKQYLQHVSVHSVKTAAQTALPTLDECMRLYCQREQLGEDNMWYCSKCQKHQRAYKKIEVWRFPKILVVHLKRFSFTSFGSRFLSRGKLETNIQFPVQDTFDLSPFLLGGTDSTCTNYSLYAISNHFGGMGGGHYIAHARHQQSCPPAEAAWFRFDDSSVSPTDVSQLQSSSAYVLFYRRNDTIEPDEPAQEERERAGTDPFPPVDKAMDEEDEDANNDAATTLDRADPDEQVLADAALAADEADDDDDASTRAVASEEQPIVVGEARVA